MKKLVIIGAGGFAKEVLWNVKAINSIRPTFEFLGFVDPGSRNTPGTVLYGAQVLGDWEHLPEIPELYFICGIGDPQIRAKECSAAESRGLLPVSVVHPSVIVADEVTIGPGTVISPNAVLAPSCTLGKHCALNIGVVVGHDARLGDFCVLSPGAQVLGGAHLESGVFLGAGSTVYLKRKMGKNSLLAANSFLMTDLPEGSSALGIPATRFSKNTGAGICTTQEQAVRSKNKNDEN